MPFMCTCVRYVAAPVPPPLPAYLNPLPQVLPSPFSIARALGLFARQAAAHQQPPTPKPHLPC